MMLEQALEYVPPPENEVPQLLDAVEIEGASDQALVLDLGFGRTDGIDVELRTVIGLCSRDDLFVCKLAKLPWRSSIRLSDGLSPVGMHECRMGI